MERLMDHASRLSLVVVLVLFLQMLADQISAKELMKVGLPSEACGYIIENGDQYQVYSTINGTPSYQTECSLRFRTDPDKAFIIRITQFKMQFSKRCSKDALYLYDGIDETAKLLIKHGYGLCGQTLSLPNYFSTSGGNVTIRLVTDGFEKLDGFNMYVTPFSKNDECEDGFQCKKDKKCITKQAKCNKAYQCEDGSDEPDNCPLGSNDLRAPCHVLLLAFILMYLLR